MICMGGVFYFEFDVINCGGVIVFMKVVHFVEVFNLFVILYGVYDVMVHLLVVVSNCFYFEVYGFGFDCYIVDSIEIDEGFVVVFEWFGYGICFDWVVFDAVWVT